MTRDHIRLTAQVVLVIIFTAASVRVIVDEWNQRPCQPPDGSVDQSIVTFLLIASIYGLAGGFSEIVKAIKGGNQ